MYLFYELSIVIGRIIVRNQGDDVVEDEAVEEES
jgi:hypothetical protein